MFVKFTNSDDSIHPSDRHLVIHTILSLDIIQAREDGQITHETRLSTLLLRIHIDLPKRRLGLGLVDIALLLLLSNTTILDRTRKPQRARPLNRPRSASHRVDPIYGV